MSEEEPPRHVSEDDAYEGYGCMVILGLTLVIGVGLAVWGIWFSG